MSQIRISVRFGLRAAIADSVWMDTLRHKRVLHPAISDNVNCRCGHGPPALAEPARQHAGTANTLTPTIEKLAPWISRLVRTAS